MPPRRQAGPSTGSPSRAAWLAPRREPVGHRRDPAVAGRSPARQPRSQAAWPGGHAPRHARVDEDRAGNRFPRRLDAGSTLSQPVRSRSLRARDAPRRSAHPARAADHLRDLASTVGPPARALRAAGPQPRRPARPRLAQALRCAVRRRGHRLRARPRPRHAPLPLPGTAQGPPAACPDRHRGQHRTPQPVPTRSRAHHPRPPTAFQDYLDQHHIKRLRSWRAVS